MQENSPCGEPKSIVENIVTSVERVELDDVLNNELGQFGKYQLRNVLLAAVLLIMSAFPNEYIFSAASVPHRCQVPECGEYSKVSGFKPDWLTNAIPGPSSDHANCKRYNPVGVNGTLDRCPASLFNQSSAVSCDGYVYAKTNSVVYEFDLGCSEWLRALAGTLNSMGTLLALPMVGYISDRFRRRTASIISVFNLGVVGLLRAFSVNYPMYLLLQILQTTIGSGGGSSAYIFVTELVGPKYRVMVGATMNSMYATGQILMATVAWLVYPWRTMLLVLNIPCLFIIFYFWLMTESVRWLLSKQKFDQAKRVLESIAKYNRKQMSEKSMEGLLMSAAITGENKIARPSVITFIINSRTLFRRVLTTPVWWMTATFVYYGLNINSTGLSETMYLNYILNSAIEIPGYFTATQLMLRIGRKQSLSGGFFLCSACNIAFACIPVELTTLRLILYLLGKFAISGVFATLYLYTSELYPTEYRHSLLAFSSMIGRIGSVIAPLTPALMEYWRGIPSLMFGGMGLLAGALVLTQPETRGLKLPDTLAEAEAIGKIPSMEPSRY